MSILPRYNPWLLYQFTGIAVLLTVIFSSTPVSAHHYIFLGQDPYTQLGGIEEPENFIYKWWVNGLYGEDLDYYIVASQLEISVLVSEFYWETALPKLKWSRNLYDEAANDLRITFYPTYCQIQGIDILGHFKVTSWWQSPEFRSANYWSKAEICLNPNMQWSTDGMTSAMMHEMGHAYGLHEQYIDQGGAGCGSGPPSIMDAMAGGVPIINHCDGQVIQPADIGRVKYAYGGITYGSLRSSHVWDDPSVAGSTVTFPYRDRGWGDVRHDNTVFWQDCATCAWQEYPPQQSYWFVEHHVAMPTPDPDWLPWIEVNRAQNNVPPGKVHVACGNPWFPQYSRFGTWSCSQYITVN